MKPLASLSNTFVFLMVFWLAALMVWHPQSACAQVYPAEISLQKMHMAKGLKASIVASEPLVRQPVAIDFDDKGRLWVIQYLQYPNPAGLNRTKVDRYSRTQYDRVPEPPPRGPKGADRLTILEDKDGDGRADSSHDFVSGLNLSTGFAFGDHGVYVIQAPYLLHYKDSNQDDIPDGDPRVLLSGFGMDDAHSLANSLTWGNDGWLYGLQGSTVTAKIRGIEFQQGIWRYHPSTDRFELYAEGGGNMWGLDFDPYGNLFASTNFGPHIALHVLQDAYYWKQFGKHGPLHNRFAFGHFDHMVNDNPQGGHVTAGGIFYQADQWPLQYRGKYIGANVLSHWVAAFDFIPVGTTFKSKQSDIVLDSQHSWFAPTDLTLGFDGSVYVADWHDARMAHPDPDADWDRTNGRIYRISSEVEKSPGLGVIPDMSKLSSAELVKGLSNSNSTIVRRSRRILKERRDKSTNSILNSIWIDPEKKSPELLRRQAFWTLISQESGMGEPNNLTDNQMKMALADHDPAIRRSAIQAIGDRVGTISDDLEIALVNASDLESDTSVLGQIAATSGRIGSVKLWESAVRKSSMSDADSIAFRLWWAAEKISQSNLVEIANSLLRFENKNIQSINKIILPRFIQKLAYIGGDEPGNRLVSFVESSKAQRINRLALVLEALRGGSPKPSGKFSGQYLSDLYQSDPYHPTYWEIAARIGLKQARDDAYQNWSLMQSRKSENLMAIYIRTAGDLKWSEWSARCFSALKSSLPELRSAAWQSISQLMSDKEILELIASYPIASEPEKMKIRELTLTRIDSCRKILMAVESGIIAKSDFDLNQVGRIDILGSPELTEKAIKIWGLVRAATPEEKLAEVRRLNNDLRAFEGNSIKGKSLFIKNCSGCHRLNGDGNVIGPDLTGSNRADRQWLLTSLVDPSGVVRKEYQSQILEMKDGRVYDGLILGQSGGFLRVVDTRGKEFQVIAGEVADRRDSPTSLMPEGLYKLFKPEELRDLFAYLQKYANSN